MRVTPINHAPKWSLPKSAVDCMLALGGITLEEIGRPKNFYLRRRKDGTEVWFRFGGQNRLSVNMSAHREILPPSFKAAREWMAENFPEVSEISGRLRDEIVGAKTVSPNEECRPVRQIFAPKIVPQATPVLETLWDS